MKKRYEDAKELIAEQPFAYWLHRVEGMGNVQKEHLLKLFGAPSRIFTADKKELKKALKPEQEEAFRRTLKQDIFMEYEALLEKGIAFYPFYHPDYPEELRSIPGRPFGIYVKGRLPGRAKKRVAVIGARNCSSYGRYVAEQFAGELAGKEIEIISGMARGIDGIAQKAALEAGGSTFAVLGCGVDVCYPASHKALYEEIRKEGGVLSEYPPGTQPLPSRFPPRNRIISGLADIVLVIEARQKSGTLITVDMALEQGKEVYVVPGRITDRLSDGCNRLLVQGAAAALTPGQLLQELTQKTYDGLQEKKAERAVLTKQEEELLLLLDFYPVSLDQIRIMMQTREMLCKLSLSETMELLVKLSVEGFIKNEGGYYGLQKPL